MKLIDNLIEYVFELTGSRIFPEELSRENRDKLPVFISLNYSLCKVSILDKDYVLLVHQRGEEPTPTQAATYVDKMRDNIQAQAVFVLPRMDAFVRNRLIGKGIPFIVPYQHLFLPPDLIDIREQSSRGLPIERGNKTISVPAQVMLLYYILHNKQVEEWPLNKWSDVLTYSRMSISRAWKELAAMDLCEGKKRGRSLDLRFLDSKRELWNRALPYLHNPVRHRKSAIIKDASHLILRNAGVTALAERTLISGGSRAVYAMRLSAWKTAIKQKKVEEVSIANEFGAVIETWRYDPIILVPHEESVDALSLYLSLQDESDERVQGALEELMDGFPW